MSQDGEHAAPGVPAECGEDTAEWRVGRDRTAKKNAEEQGVANLPSEEKGPVLASPVFG